MQQLQSLKAVKKFINENELSFIYVYLDRWVVCHDLLPQVEEVLKEFPNIKAGIVNGEKVPKIASFLMAFTVPVLALFADGKEVLREARMVQIEKLRNDLRKIYDLYYEE